MAALPSATPGLDELVSDATEHPTFAPTNTYFPTFRPTNTYFPTKGSATATPTFFPSYITYAPTPTEYLIDKPDDVAVGAPTTPTMKPTMKDSYEDSSQDSFSFTGDPFEKKPTSAPVTAAPVDNSRPTIPPKQPTSAPTMANLAGVKGEFRRKSVGFQSNWGPAHTGSMIYDFTRNTIYVSGTKIQPDTSNDFQRSTCFVGQLPIADAELWKMADPPLPPNAKGKVLDFKIPEDLVERESMACHVVYYDDESKTDDNLYVGGVYEKDATDRKGGIRAFLNTFQRNRNNPNWKLQLDPTPLVNPDPSLNKQPPAPVVDYPVAMVSGKDGRMSDSIMVITVGSDEPLMTEEYIENQDARNSNNMRNALQPPGVVMGDPSRYAVAKRGDNYFMSFNKYMVEKKKLVYKHSQQVKSPNGGNVYPTGIINLDPDGEDFVVVGSIQGRPPAEMHLSWHAEAHFKDLDGFVNRYFFPRNRPSFDPSHAIRISSTENNPPLDDFVHGVCPGKPAEDGYIREYYIVGSTYGTLPKGKKQKKLTTNIVSEGDYSDAGIHGNAINRLTAYATKIKNGFPEWTTQLYAINPEFRLDDAKTEALGCHLIDSHPDSMYIAGTVYDGGLMDSTQRSKGGDDVWVAKLATEDGSLQWIRQIGSAGSDKLSRTNGLEVDVNGHAIVYGSTNGEMFRKKGRGEPVLTDNGSSSDVFVTSFDMMSGESESTIETDRSASKKKGVAGGVSAAVIVLAILALVFYLRGRKRTGRSRPRPTQDSDSNLNMAFKDEPESDGEEAISVGGYTDSTTAPPASAFGNDSAKIV